MAINKITTGSIQNNTVTADDIQDGAITNAKVNACAAIAQSKISGLTTSISNLCSSISSVSSAIGQQANNIGLLGFKMAVNDGLTVFNLVDGVVDEFNDESGTDEAEGSNDNYCGTDDYYSNTSSGCISAGFSTTAITEPDTSTTGTNPAIGTGTMGQFTVPCGMTSLNIQVWGAGGGAGYPTAPASRSGGGGYSEGTLAVTGSQTIYVSAGEGGKQGPAPDGTKGGFLNGGDGNAADEGGGGGLAGTFSVDLVPLSVPQYSAPTAYVVAGSGGGGGYHTSAPGVFGGAGGGLSGDSGGQTTECNSASSDAGGGGGGQTAGGGVLPGSSPPATTGQVGYLFGGGDAGCRGGGGGAGYYGGGGGARYDPQPYGSGGGGSSYYGHPQITSGSTEEGSQNSGGGTGQPGYVPGTNEGTPMTSGSGEDGYVLLTGSFNTVTSTTIISTAFTSTSVATSARIVVFEENVDTPTLNTDIIASVSRDAGVTFTNATLTDSGYVTGSSGQRILTGQADISGQPSGQSMRWKLALANNTVKIHGVALQWS